MRKKKVYTVEEKKAYYEGLRRRWKEAKAVALNGRKAEIEAIIMNHGLDISPIGFWMISVQMRALGLDGLPYLDAKTYQGWKENGFQVRKGEKSKLSGVTWISAGGKQDDSAGDDVAEDDGYVFPKEYHLFHRSQVEEVAS